MRRYESLIILDPDLPDEDIVGFTERYSQLIKTSGGEIIKIEDWGSKKLAYLVKKRDRGRYILIDFVGLPALITEMERQFKISDEVMKFLSVKLDDSVDLDAFKAAQETPPEPEPQAEEPAPADESEQPVAQEDASAAAEVTAEEPVTTETAESEAPAASTEPTEPTVDEPAPAAEAAESTPAEPASEDTKEGE